MQLRLFRILWGPTLETVLDFVWPVAGDAPRAWRQPREGSERVTADTVTDVAITGRDYFLSVTAKWLALPYLTGGTGLQAFIDWANAGNAFTLMPDPSLPTLTVPGCFLDAPFADPSWSTEDDGSQTVELVIRHPTRDLALAWRGLFFEYVAGQSLTDPVAYTFSRASVGYEVNNQGYLTQNPSGTLCDGHYPAPLGTGIQTTLLEAAVTNDVTNPEDLGNASWTKSECTITANNAKAPDQAKTADLVVESVTAAATHLVRSNAITIVAGDTVTALWFVRDGGRFKGWMRVVNSAFTNSFGVDYDLHAGTIAAHVQGTGALVASKMIALAGGLYMIWIRGTLDPATSTSCFLDGLLADAAGTIAYTGDGVSGTYFWGATVVHGPTNTVAAYTPTSAVADSLKGAYTTVPQAQWFYLKFVESGQALVVDASRGGVLAVGCTAVTSPAMDMLTDNGAAGKYIFRHVNAAAAAVQAVAASSPAQGDTVELLGLRFADGSVQIIQSINGGAEVASAASAALAIDYTTWTDSFIGLGMRRGGITGTVAVALFKTGPLVTSGPSAVTTVAAARAA